MYSFASMIWRCECLLPLKGSKGRGSGTGVGFTTMLIISYRIKGDSVTMVPYLTITRGTARRRVWRRVVSALSKLGTKPTLKTHDGNVLIRVDLDYPMLNELLVMERTGEVLDELGLQNTISYDFYDYDAEVSGERVRTFITTMAHRMMMSQSMSTKRKGRPKKLHHVLNVSKKEAFTQLLNVAYGCKESWSGSSIPYVLSNISLADVAACHPKGYDKLLKTLANVRRVKTSWKSSP